MNAVSFHCHTWWAGEVHPTWEWAGAVHPPWEWVDAVHPPWEWACAVHPPWEWVGAVHPTWEWAGSVHPPWEWACAVHPTWIMVLTQSVIVLQCPVPVSVVMWSLATQSTPPNTEPLSQYSPLLRITDMMFFVPLLLPSLPTWVTLHASLNYNHTGANHFV